MLQCLSSAVPQCYSASVLQCLSAIVLLLKNAIELLFFYEVAYRQTEPLLKVLADLKITDFHFDLSLHQPPEHSLNKASRVLADLQPGLPLHAGDNGYN